MSEIFNVENFSKINLPEKLGVLENKDIFSKQSGIRVLDMPIFMPGSYFVKIPIDISIQFHEPIEMALKDIQRTFRDSVNDRYIYATIDQKVVEKDKTGRRAGAHSDAYIELSGNQVDGLAPYVENIEEISYTYVVSDEFPTEFFNCPFPLDKSNLDCESSLKYFDEVADKCSDVVTYEPYSLLKLTPYVIHRSAVADKRAYRTFMKISVSKKKYSREGNTHNPLFDYDWLMTSRNSSRNHPWS